MHLELLESRTRRAVFLEAVIAELQLADTKVVCDRAETYLRNRSVPPFDVISWKAIKLSNEAFGLLMDVSRPDSRFWLFHGADLPVADPADIDRRLILLRRERFPGARGVAIVHLRKALLTPDWFHVKHLSAPCFT